MTSTPLPPSFDLETLNQLPKEELVSIIVQQQRVIEQLVQEVHRLKISLHLDSQTSSKPPSTDLLKKPEQKPSGETEPPPTAAERPKRKPGGQPGHQGKTRKGFGRVDRYEILRPQTCSECGSQEFAAELVLVQGQQVAQLVARPIEVVEYQQHSCECVHCGHLHTAPWPESIVPGQDLGVSLQAFHVSAGELWSLILREAARIVAGVRGHRDWFGHLGSDQCQGL